MNINEIEEELLSWKKENICHLIVGLMDKGKLDITDINLCHTRAIESRLAEKDKIIFDADTLLFESLFNDSIGKTADAKQMMKKVKWIEERGTHNMDGIMESLLKDRKTPVKSELKRTVKQGEQKPTNKIEHKFNEGDWIVHQGTENVYQVVAVINNNQYQLKYGGIYTVQKCVDIDRYARLWTIQDAKDGDVLVSPATPEGDKECPFIFKEIDKNGVVRFHAALLQNKDLEISNDVSNVIGYANAGYHVPATKEQRDTLEKAMADAGYTFDFEKKEMKKIEQKSTEWSEEDEIKIKSIIALLKSPALCAMDGNKGIIDETIKYLKTFKERIQPKQEWSEYDETNASYIVAALDCYYRLREERNNTNGQENLDKARNWLYNKLKFLRPQINVTDKELTEQKHAGWSDYDECMLTNLIDDQHCSIDSEYVHWLKSLKDRVQPKQERSEEDEKAINVALSLLRDQLSENKYPYLSKIYVRAIKNLKFLKERYTWKPSDEQMKSLYKYAEQNNYDGAILTSLYKDLKRF